MNVQLALLGHVEQAQHGQRVALEQVRLGGRDPAGLDHHAVDPAPPEAEPAQVQARLALVLHLERGAEDAGQRADLLRDQVVVLHEPLDGARRAPIAVAHALRDLRLQVEGETLLGAIGQIVQVAAYGPQELPGLGEPTQRPGIEHAVRDQFLRPLDPVEEATEPEQGLQIAQPALALLHVRLEQVAAVAGALVAGIALRQLGLDERGAARADHLVLEALLELLEQAGVAPQKARLEQIGADRQVGAGGAHAVGDRARRLAHFEAEVPEAVEQELDHLLAVRGPLVRMQEQQVDVGVRGELGAAVAADRDHRHALAFGRIGAPEYPGERVVQQALDQRVDQAAVIAHGGLGVVVRLEARPDRRPRPAQPAAQRGQEGGLVAARLEQDVELGARACQVQRGRRVRRMVPCSQLSRHAHPRIEARPCPGQHLVGQRLQLVVLARRG